MKKRPASGIQADGQGPASPAYRIDIKPATCLAAGLIIIGNDTICLARLRTELLRNIVFCPRHTGCRSMKTLGRCVAQRLWAVVQ
ncbi:MAG: hypothetical protein Tsb002_30940 [Wenzhouxiangellaceae bacterium]